MKFFQYTLTEKDKKKPNIKLEWTVANLLADGWKFFDHKSVGKNTICLAKFDSKKAEDSVRKFGVKIETPDEVLKEVQSEKV